MKNDLYADEIAARRTFAIISHPDAGKTTITKKVLLFGQAIQTAGTVKGRGSNQHAKSDWMEMEKQRGISITTSVMQFPYRQALVNLLDTPGHEDFFEDTYRTLTAVDCCLMVIDAAKGVEDRTRKLMEVSRLRDTPILTFMNKVDRDIRDPMELLDEVESELRIACAPITWPIGCGKLFKGIYHLAKDETYLYQSGQGHTIQAVRVAKGLDNPELDRVAFLRVVSGRYEKSMKLRQVRTGKDAVIADALTFMAGDRSHIEEAYAGDIIGLHNHGTIQIGDTFTQGEELKFTGIPNFAPELFRSIRLRDPLKQKQLLKGLVQLSKEGAVHVFRSLANNDLIVGTVGVLQFDVVVARLKSEYNVEALYESVSVSTARWVECGDAKKLEAFKRKNELNLALDGGDNLSYIAPSMVNLNLTRERYPDIQFHKTREH